LAGVFVAVGLTACALWPEPTRALPATQGPPLLDNWRTDFSRRTAPLDEFQAGGPPRDGIPALTGPRYVSAADAGGWLRDAEPVISLVVSGDVRAYPIEILVWHEIVNDVVGDTPVAVTFCPLCNTATVFDARLDGRPYTFGTSGLLRNSNLVMYDRETETWWQQDTGEGLVGTLAGRKLDTLPAQLVGWRSFRETYPEGRVLSRETGYRRDYGRNPYAGYDNINQTPFLMRGMIDGRLAPMERVVTVELGGSAVAYPYSALRQQRAVNQVLSGTSVVVFWQEGSSSPFSGAEVGQTGVFRPEVDGQRLTFVAVGDRFQDLETRSTWNVFGQAQDGPLAGRQLQAVPHTDQFWFSWAAFRPETTIYQP
jgi:hypothetical protein